MTTILVFAFVAVSLVLVISVFTVAWRGGTGEPPPKAGKEDRGARRRDRPARKAGNSAADGAATTEAPEAADEAGAEEAAPVDPLLARPEIPQEEYEVTRRQFFNRGILGIFAIFLAQFGIAGLAYMWPRLQSGGFGSKVSAGKVEDIEAQIFTPDGRVQPLFVSAAQAYVLPFQGPVEGSVFEGLPVIAGGLIALWQRCVHLGCRVPQCDTSQGFECPCHGSKYNYHGEYEDGPAPRNLDRFVVSISDTNELIIDTGQVIQTARSTTKTAEYPQGPSCI